MARAPTSSAGLGATVSVELVDGSERSFRITDLVEYPKAELPFEEVFAEGGSSRLVLITCGGDFNPELRSYESNVVAYAEPLG